MAHRLIVMRHAKAGDLPGGPDLERALTGRGRRAAAAAGQWLRAEGLVPEAGICSPARRTRQTWQQVAAELGRAVAMTTVAALYQATAADVADEVRLTRDAVGTLLYLGHNPAAGQLAGDLTGSYPDFPTAAIAVIELPGPWADLTRGAGTLLARWTPKEG